MELAETYKKIYPAIVAFVGTTAWTQRGRAPHFPPVIGTGFFVDPRGIVATNRHVVDALDVLPWDISTRKTTARALVSFGLKSEANGGTSFPVGFIEIRAWRSLTAFSKPSNWYGQEVPDIAFVQLEIQEVPFLELAESEYYVEPGMSIATAGYPTGELFMTVNEKVTQPFPTLRRGIVSIPFPCSAPHGFTMDIMQQGGASGSPIFRCDEPVVLGIVYGGFPTWNYSLAVPSHIVAGALRSVLSSQEFDFDNVPTLRATGAGADFHSALGWERWSPFQS